MKKLLPIIILFLALSVAGQETTSCSENMMKINIGGFSPGMTQASANKYFNDPKWSVMPAGNEVVFIKNFQDKERFKGISALILAAFEGKIYAISAMYDNTLRANNINEFSQITSKSLNITEKWQQEGTIARIDCKERSILLTFTLRSATINIPDIAASLAKKNQQLEKQDKH